MSESLGNFEKKNFKIKCMNRFILEYLNYYFYEY